MFCTNCGKEINNENSFCTSCGVAVNNENQVNIVNEVVPNKKSKKGLVIGICLGVVVLIGAIIGGFFVVSNMKDDTFNNCEDLAKAYIASIENKDIELYRSLYNERTFIVDNADNKLVDRFKEDIDDYLEGSNELIVTHMATDVVDLSESATKEIKEVLYDDYKINSNDIQDIKGLEIHYIVNGEDESDKIIAVKIEGAWYFLTYSLSKSIFI